MCRICRLSVLAFISWVRPHSCLQLSAVVISSSLLLACGGDDDSANPAVNDAFVDTQAPVISLNGEPLIIVGQGRPYLELHATAMDDVDGEVEVVLSSATVDTDTLGDYTLVYSAEDSSGNQSSVTRIVSVVEPRPFITTWKIEADNDEVIIPTRSSRYTYDYNIDWGDGTIEENQTGDVRHTYTLPGTYTISINGVFPNLTTLGGSEKLPMLSLEQWEISSGNLSLIFSLVQKISPTTQPIHLIYDW
ncbi:membrane associated lipoprotein precursor [Vibrio sp. JCM 19236]|nr:membrane associated lipoprotein precursor [Vibrio sp. JCM 19236]